MHPPLDSELVKIVIDPRSYADDTVLHQALARIRRESPLARIETAQIDPFWLVELTGIPLRTVANFVGGPKRLPIRFKMA